MTEDLASKEKEEYDLMMKEEGRRKNEWKNDGQMKLLDQEEKSEKESSTTLLIW